MNDYNKRTGWQRPRAIFSLNDPRWGRGEGNGQRTEDTRRPSGNNGNNGGGKGDGPPDLDEMWRDFNRRLSSLFGKKGKGPGGIGPRQDNGHGARIGVGLVLGVLIAIYVGSGVFVVQDGQAGVVLQFGQYRHTVGQGVHWRLPFPFQTHEIVNIGQIRSVEIGRNNLVRPSNVKDASVLTHDGDILDVRFTVQYQVKQPTDYLFRSVDPDLTVSQAAQAAVRTVVGAHSTNDLLYADREPIRAQLADTIQHALDEYRTGLGVTGVTIQSVTAPDQVQAAFDDEAKAHQDRERAKRDAQAYADQLLPRAQADGARLIDDAKAYSDRVVAQAQGDAQRFNSVYEQYAKAPAVIRERMYLDTMQHIYSNTTKVFVDSKSGNNVIYLPLDKLVEATRQRAAAAAGAAAATGAAAQNVAPNAAANAASAPDANAAAPSANSDTQPQSAQPQNTQQGAQQQGAAPAPSASDAAQAASDAFRSRDALRSRGREDDVQ
ncbi:MULTISPECIES: FtsH protease activity modulator HflK [Paraburkholderia]|uniref:Protein HflK n=1 Tax=Paraburkholderia tropica TaxID=92647 RepID=A0A1A5XDE5_9BURK|nr:MULTISPECIES: FtsH protease activity modulator HflK [Paraburkholderia]MBB2981346.1 membrane protease subunit HflK [Paraburkholderia tropica]OBR51457.1 protease modulator HflK [Paraburkholderia tropica]QNB11184.1 FtsH protease activity modulator HflK [Paraburkholderia tropica]RQM47943.1 FtsH protease activity modulator HflK [Paraburkholderia bannensis]RQN38671.1 FtsH protease activity modulator HflK [Paraburkholderia tropica]